MATAVTKEDEAVVASLISAFNLRDLERMLAALDPAVEFHPLRVFGVEHEYHGHAGVREWFARLAELDHQHRAVVCEITATSGEAVTASGWVEVGDDESATLPFCAVYQVDDGLITVAHHYLSDRATLDRVGIAT